MLSPADAFFKDLLPDEKILWQGQPAPGIHLTPMIDALFIPFSIFWGAHALIWNGAVWAKGAPWFFRLFGLPFLCAVLYITVGRFFYRAWLNQRTWYAVTNARVLICQEGLFSVRRYFMLDRVAEVQRLNGTGGVVHVFLGSVWGVLSNRALGLRPVLHSLPATDAEIVMQLIATHSVRRFGT